MLISKNRKVSNHIGTKCKCQMTKFNVFNSASRISIYYINRRRCGTPNQIISSNAYTRQYWAVDVFSNEIILIPKILWEKTRGSNENQDVSFPKVEPSIAILLDYTSFFLLLVAQSWLFIWFDEWLPSYSNFLTRSVTYPIYATFWQCMLHI